MLALQHFVQRIEARSFVPFPKGFWFGAFCLFVFLFKMSRKVWNIFLLRRKVCTSLTRSTLDNRRDPPVGWTPQWTPAYRE